MSLFIALSKTACMPLHGIYTLLQHFVTIGVHSTLQLVCCAHQNPVTPHEGVHRHAVLLRAINSDIYKRQVAIVRTFCEASTRACSLPEIVTAVLGCFINISYCCHCIVHS